MSKTAVQHLRNAHSHLQDAIAKLQANAYDAKARKQSRASLRMVENSIKEARAAMGVRQGKEEQPQPDGDDDEEENGNGHDEDETTEEEQAEAETPANGDPDSLDKFGKSRPPKGGVK